MLNWPEVIAIIGTVIRTYFNIPNPSLRAIILG